MNVLRYRARSFVSHNLSWNNIRFQWAVIGMVILSSGLTVGFNFLEGIARWSLIIWSAAFALQFFSAAAISSILYKDLPWLVRLYSSAGTWWRNQSPAYLTTHNGQKVLARDEFPVQSLYDKDGVWIGDWCTHYEINLLTLFALKDNKAQIPSSMWFEPASKFRRLSWLARLLSPKIP